MNFYLKKNATSTNIYIGQTFITSIGPLSSIHLNKTLILPTSIASTNYNILAYADPYKTRTETNRNNNYRLSSTKISVNNAYKDSVVTGIGAKIYGYSGNKLYVSNTIKNIGTMYTTGFWVHYYVKEGNSPKYLYRPELRQKFGANTSKTLNSTIKLSSSIVAKNYYVTSYVDAHKNISETNDIKKRCNIILLMIFCPEYLVVFHPLLLVAFYPCTWL